MKSFIAQKKEKLNKSVLRFYGDKLSYGEFMKLLRKKDISVCGKRVNTDVTVDVGDEIKVYYDESKKNAAAKPLTVAFKDDNLLVAVKPAKTDIYEFESLIKVNYPSARLAHRLDTNTQGLVVFTLNDVAEKEAFRAFKSRLIKKAYLAEVYGVFSPLSGRLTDYLIKDEKSGTVKIFKTPVAGAVKVITEYETLETRGETSLLKVDLITGKTHQIRAHLAFYGHFIIGDGKYGVNEINKKYKAKYQRLIAAEITFNFGDGSPLSYLNGKTVKADLSAVTFPESGDFYAKGKL